MGPNEQARRVFDHYRLRLGVERPSVTAYHSDDRSLSVDLMHAADLPARGLVTVATLGLPDASNASPSRDVRVELLLAAPCEIHYAANVLATVAFDVIRGPFPGAWPGAVKPTAVQRNEPDAAMPDVLLIPTFCWEDLDPLPGVHFLQVIPIHASESAYCLEKGSDSLEELFQDRQIDVFDWHRASVT
ncbi:MAG: suppressor of fused domain protein [Actinomycetota bacterium]|nr:suppressor of fused domain protein [Actinomycetota bacterium]